MKKKLGGLDPIHGITKSQASYEKLMLEMMSKLVGQIRDNNQIVREHLGKPSRGALTNTYTTFKDKNNLPLRVPPQEWSDSFLSPIKNQNGEKVEEVFESLSGKNLNTKAIKHSSSSESLHKEERSYPNQSPEQQSKIIKVLENLEHRLKVGEEVNKKLLEKIQRLQIANLNRQSSQSKEKPRISIKDIKQSPSKQNEISLIEKAIADKFQKNVLGDNQGKKNSYILSEILPYSDRREIKVKFKISDILNMAQQLRMDDLKLETAEWLGQVYRATASICWNMLLNNYLSFQEVKILFTQNIIFNFVEFMKEVKKIGKEIMLGELTAIVNKKSVSILDFLCRQYPQTKIEAPNLALRSILPQIDNQGRSKYDLVCKSGISFTFRQDGDYTSQIMRMINFMIERSNDQFNDFLKFIRETFDQVFLPIHKRKKFDISSKRDLIDEPTHDDMIYREKVKGYTKYAIGRKIPKNTLLYTEEQIEDGIFFVKSNAVLRIITKWVQQLKEYFQDPDKKIKHNYNENKDHDGNIMYLSALLKNGIHKEILNQRKDLFDKINHILKQCQKMEHLLTAEEYTSDPTQVHLSEEQISVGIYSCNIKSVISSYICSELNELIHFLLKIPRDVPEDTLSDEEVFQSQARKELDSVNLVTFKLSDLLRCKIHSNEDEIIWIVQYLLFLNETDRKRFKIIRIKDRLGLGTRDIMINGQVNKGLSCQIQLAVTSNSDKKQQLLDQYNHFLYELKRSELGSIIENVSIWSNLEQRYSYFQQLIKKKKRGYYVQSQSIEKHKCGLSGMKSFKRPLICQKCHLFYPIPTTCLLNVQCNSCGITICGQCYYYNYLDQQERKKFIFDNHRLFKQEVMNKLIEYTDFTKPLPQTGFFIKKNFLTKELSFYMAIQRNKQENVKDAPSIEILFTQTIIRNGKIFNRQVNKKQIFARLEKGEFYVDNYQKTELNNFIIFYFDKKETKKMMTLNDIQAELQKPEHGKTKVLSILKQPSYVQNLHLLKKQSQKLKELQSIRSVIENGKVIVYIFNHFFLLAQVLVKGSMLREEIRKRINISLLKSLAEKDLQIVSMEYRNMTTELEDIATKFTPKLYSKFAENLKKLFLSNGEISSLKCLQNFTSLETVFVNENRLTSLQGLENLMQLMSLKFDNNQVESLACLSKISGMRYLSGSSNKIKSLKGLEDLKELRSLCLYNNEIESIGEIRNHPCLEELYINQNPVTDLSVVQSLKKLTKLFIGKTKPKALPNLAGLKELKCLSLQSLNLDKIPAIFEGLSLTELSLSHNKITEISNLTSQTELLSLTLSHNSITEITNLECMDKLIVLKLVNNKIKKVTGVRNLDSIKYISLKNNPIDDIGELGSVDIHFKYALTQEDITENAKKQLQELQNARNAHSSSED